MFRYVHFHCILDLTRPRTLFELTLLLCSVSVTSPIKHVSKRNSLVKSPGRGAGGLARRNCVVTEKNRREKKREKETLSYTILAATSLRFIT